MAIPIRKITIEVLPATDQFVERTSLYYETSDGSLLSIQNVIDELEEAISALKQLRDKEENEWLND